MSRQRIPLWGNPRNHATVETEATIGATVGRNLFGADGELIPIERLINPPPAEQQDVYPSIWRLLLEIPPNIVALAALEGGGFAYMDSVGNWRVRRLGRQVIDFSYGDASPTLVYTAPHALTVITTRLTIRTPFNGGPSALSVGTLASPSLLLSPTQSDPAAAASFETHPDAVLAAGDALYLTIDPNGASAGAGQLVIDTIPSEGI